MKQASCTENQEWGILKFFESGCDAGQSRMLLKNQMRWHARAGYVAGERWCCVLGKSETQLWNPWAEMQIDPERSRKFSAPAIDSTQPWDLVIIMWGQKVKLINITGYLKIFVKFQYWYFINHGVWLVNMKWPALMTFTCLWKTS